ncbi:MAG: patatin family protein [Lachnospiraceae bacterium]|nr:patatin family protein [Lachnospiraceae bacterium]
MKGAYTAGVLDFFLDKGIDFAKCYGVSAGATTMCSYLSKQRGRALATMIDYLDDKNYCSVSSLLKTGDIFNVEMCYHAIPDRLNPYDYAAFEKNESRGYAVVTNIETGLAEYMPLLDMHKDIEAVRASASLPLVSRNVEINGKWYLDGAMADSIPLLHSMTDGNKKNVVILTKEVGYRRKPSSTVKLIRLRYKKYPKVYELMKNRHIQYNQTLDFIGQQVKCGNAFLIQPQHKSEVGRLEKDREKLKALYQTGYEEAAAQYEALMAFLLQ